MEPDTLFQVTISCRGMEPVTYVLPAQLPSEAVDNAWARFEAEHGPVVEFRAESTTTVTRYFPPEK